MKFSEFADVLLSPTGKRSDLLIILPFYKEYEYLEKHLNYLNKQSFVEFDLILILNQVSEEEKIVQIIKSVTAREIFAACPEVKKQLWGGEFWTDGYFINTVGQHGTENMIQQYIKNQGMTEKYTSLHTEQMRLF